jgi:hypothetical protein
MTVQSWTFNFATGSQQRTVAEFTQWFNAPNATVPAFGSVTGLLCVGSSSTSSSVSHTFQGINSNGPFTTPTAQLQ